MHPSIDPAHLVTDEASLADLYPEISRLAQIKVLTALEPHSLAFIARSPLLFIASADAEGRVDVSPRGDAPGFVVPLDDRTLLLPDRPGNNRLDTLRNLLKSPRIGLVFVVPGIEETLRINGTAVISADTALRERVQAGGRLPRTVVVITVDELFMHCGKALRRACAWGDLHRAAPGSVPSLGRVIVEQSGTSTLTVDEAEALVEHSYKHKLY